jgi:putative NIF3 family GTP cyclohydrolase 1 type 2
MKIVQVIEKILEYHPTFSSDYDGCDGYKSGNPEVECTGIATALVPTVEVIRKAAEFGCNLLYVHEPTFYSTPDYPDWRAGFENEVYEEKRALLEETGMVIYRDHDHTHVHRPDGIFTGVIKYLGWEENQIKQEGMTMYFEFSDMTVGKMNQLLKEKLSLNGIRYIGRLDSAIKRVAIVGHLLPNIFEHQPTTGDGFCPEYATEVIRLLEEEDVDAIIPGEVIDWTVISYIRDAVQLGKTKAVFNVGHFNIEELGMKYAKDWILELVDHKLPVQYIPTGDIYSFE